MKGNDQGLCLRCEYRAQHYESGHAPRSECHEPAMNMARCYMYLPVKPVSLKYPEYAGEYGELNDQRSPVSGIMGARMEAAGVIDYELNTEEKDGIFTHYWIPERIEP